MVPLGVHGAACHPTFARIQGAQSWSCRMESEAPSGSARTGVCAVTSTQGDP